MQRRLRHAGLASPGIHALEAAMRDRAILEARSVTVQVTSSDGAEKTTWDIAPASIPGLIVLRPNWTSARFEISEEMLERNMREHPAAIQESHTPHITTLHKDKLVLRGDDSSLARAGFAYDIPALSSSIAKAFRDGVPSISVTAPFTTSSIVMDINGTPQALTLLASGRSNFTSSPSNRQANVNKALFEHVHNTVVEPGATFSFNATLNAPITLEKGWKEALGLFGGGAAMTPGGGICQAATTVYRAALLAGFPFIEKRNHSLFVSYYEKYGVGIDATIFPGVHDLVFKNDTAGYLVVQATTEGEDAIVSIYGIDDRRDVVMHGPYFAGSAKRHAPMRSLDFNEIGWVQEVVRPDGTVRNHPIISHYAKPVPRSLARTYTGNVGVLDLHGAAPEVAPDVN